MKLIKPGLLALSIISNTCFALPLNDSSLPQRCHQAYLKLKTLSDQQSDMSCSTLLMGSQFDIAGEYIASNDMRGASYLLTSELKDLKYAETIGCNGQATIQWAISEAQQIKDIIS